MGLLVLFDDGSFVFLTVPSIHDHFACLRLFGLVSIRRCGKKFQLSIAINVANLDFMHKSIGHFIEFYQRLLNAFSCWLKNSHHTSIVGRNDEVCNAVVVDIAHFNISQTVKFPFPIAFPKSFLVPSTVLHRPFFQQCLLSTNGQNTILKWNRLVKDIGIPIFNAKTFPTRLLRSPNFQSCWTRLRVPIFIFPKPCLSHQQTLSRIAHQRFLCRLWWFNLRLGGFGFHLFFCGL